VVSRALIAKISVSAEISLGRFGWQITVCRYCLPGANLRLFCRFAGSRAAHERDRRGGFE
jgi:hypothetical protein